MTILGHDFKHQLIVDYSSSNTCDTSGCIEEGICRCTELYDCHVKSVRVDQISNIIYESFFDKSKSSKRNIKINEILFGLSEEVERYTVDRILRINKIWKNECWDVQVLNGYYGQEVDVVIFKTDLAIKIQNQIGLALNILSINKRVEFLLELEYGKILPHLQNLNWKLIRLKKDDIIFPSESHLEKVKYKDLSHYYAPKYNSIRAVVLKDGDKWKLVDGYHRLSAISIGDFWVLAGDRN